MKKISIYGFTILMMVAVFLSACQPNNNVVNEDKITITTTIFPLYDFAKHVAGDKAEVILLLPSGADPHYYEPRPSDIVRIQNSGIFIFVGEILEPWAHNVASSLSQNIIVIEASELVELIEGHQDEHNETEEVGSDEELHESEEEHGHEYDPHIWLSFSNNVIIIESIKNSLIQLDEENSAYYEQNAMDLIQRMNMLSSEYQTGLSSCSKEQFISGGHNIFGYLEHDYDIHGVNAIESLAPDAEPTPKRMAELIDLAREYDTKYILSEVLISPRLSEAIASEVGAEVLLFDPAHNKPNDDRDFIMVMQDNLEVLQTALECN